MSIIGNRLKILERKLTPKEEQTSTVEYVEEYVYASEKKRHQMAKPVITIELLKEMIDKSVFRAVSRMSKEEIKERLREIKEAREE